MLFRAGDRVNHYTLLEALGEGGQGSVWKVVDPRDGGVERALKLVSLTETGPAAFSRAVREARILASAQHPALVTCHSFFEEPRDGVVGLLMDLVHGRSLADVMETRGLDREQSLALLAQVVDALAYVHGENLVHRDLKPGNIMLTEAFWQTPTRAGAVKLVDFGIAAGAGNATQLTTPGAVIGTLPYLAPELVDPATWGKSEGTPRDVFALGVMAYQLLMHKHPTGLGFDAAMIDFARAYKAAEAGRIVWPPPGLTGGWGAAVGQCLALRPADRPASGSAVLDLLRTGVAGTRELRPVPSQVTSLYGAARGEVRTEVPVTPVSVRTAPMPFPSPDSMRTIEQAPVRDAFAGAPSPPSKKLWAALLVLGGAIGGAVLFALLHGSSGEVPTIPLPTAAPPTPVPTDVAASAPAPIAPCRRAELHFDARATRFGCPVCEGEPGPIPQRTWQMRFSGVSGAAIGSAPGMTVCAEVSGRSKVCVPFARLPDYTGAAGRLPVTTADIDEGRVVFSILDKAGTVASGRAHRKAGTTRFLETALCSGFVLHLDDPAITISVFLDER